MGQRERLTENIDPGFHRSNNIYIHTSVTGEAQLGCSKATLRGVARLTPPQFPNPHVIPRASRYLMLSKIWHLSALM